MYAVPPKRNNHECGERGDEDDDGREEKDPAVGAARDDVLLEEEFQPIGGRLQQAARPGAGRAEAVLHEGDDLTFVVGHVRHHRQGNEEQDNDRDGREPPWLAAQYIDYGEGHRSVASRRDHLGPRLFNRLDIDGADFQFADSPRAIERRCAGLV